jgi:hypothetical protein
MVIRKRNTRGRFTPGFELGVTPRSPKQLGLLGAMRRSIVASPEHEWFRRCDTQPEENVKVSVQRLCNPHKLVSLYVTLPVLDLRYGLRGRQID